MMMMVSVIYFTFFKGNGLEILEFLLKNTHLKKMERIIIENLQNSKETTINTQSSQNSLSIFSPVQQPRRSKNNKNNIL